MRTVVVLALNWLARIRLKKSLVSLTTGRRGRIYLWRINSGVPASVSVGSDTVMLSKVILEQTGAVLKVGDRTFVGSGLISVATYIEIGDDVLMSWGVSVTDHNSHSIQFSKRENDVVNWIGGRKDWSGVIVTPVRIGNKSWIGFDVKILKGVSIGEGSIVGAGSVVTKDVPPWTIVAGNPARVIREIPENER